MWTCPGSPCVCVCVLYVYMCNGCPSWSGCVVLCWLDRLYTRDFTHHFYSKTPIGIRAHRTYVVYVVRICYVLFWSPPLSLSLSRHCLCVWTLSLSLSSLSISIASISHICFASFPLSLSLSLSFSLSSLAPSFLPLFTCSFQDKILHFFSDPCLYRIIILLSCI